MSPITNVVVAAALAIGLGGAVVAATVADPSSPPGVGDPVIIERDQTGEPAGSAPTGQAAPPHDSASTADPGDDGDDLDTGPDAGPDDQHGAGTGTIEDDDVVQIYPSPRTLDDDGDDDGGDDGGDDTDDRGDD